MRIYCDTSFFIRRLLPGPFRETAIVQAEQIQDQIGFVPIVGLTRFEIIQGLRFESWLHQSDRSKGHPPNQVDMALNIFLAQLNSDFRLVSVDFDRVLSQAESLTRSTPEHGWRTLDILHVATALSLQAGEFFRFDQKQNQLAEMHGLRAPLIRADA